MLLPSIWKKDKVYAFGLGVLLLFYAILHVIKLEMFPFYLFAMYSLPLAPHHENVVYKVYDSAGSEVDFSGYNYRNFVYIHNTIQAYEEVLKSPNNTPNIGVIDKFIDHLHLENSFLGQQLANQYKQKDIHSTFQSWLASVLNNDPPFTIQACEYRWIEGRLSLKQCKAIEDE